MFIFKSINLPPLGLGYLAAVLEKAGHSVGILDLCANGSDYKQALRFLLKERPDIVGISATTPNIEQAYILAKNIKESLGVPIVMGGPHATFYPDEIFRDSKDIDIIVLGEGENAIIGLVDALQEKKPLGAVPGIRWKNLKGEIVRNAVPVFEKNLDIIPFPARHLFKNKHYTLSPNSNRKLTVTSMITSRGCPYSRCLFCFKEGEHISQYRRRSPGNVISEIKWLVSNYGTRKITFWDDDFAINNGWISEFCGLIKNEKLDIAWSCYGRVDTVSEAMLKNMREGGCFSIHYGFESGNQDILNKLNKGTTLEQARQAVKWTQAAGIETKGSFMLFLPEENPLKAKKTIDFALELDLDSASFIPFRPFRGTKFYETAIAEGKVYPGAVLFAVGYLPSGYRSIKEALNVLRSAYLRFYCRYFYMIKLFRKAKNVIDIKNYLKGCKFIAGIVINLRRQSKSREI